MRHTTAPPLVLLFGLLLGCGGGDDQHGRGYLTRENPKGNAKVNVPTTTLDVSGTCRVDAQYRLVGACPQFCANETRRALAECPASCEGFDYECAALCEAEATLADESESLSVESATTYDQAFSPTLEMTCFECVNYAFFACGYEACPAQSKAWDDCLVANDLGPEAEDFSACASVIAAFYQCIYGRDTETTFDRCYHAREEQCFHAHINR